jgi:pimeloyl-ACP methyl ester carboxylesterase
MKIAAPFSRSGINLMNIPTVSFKTALVNGFKIFYREAGDPQKPAVLLLHGFPTSSQMFRNLIPQLADDYHVVAPDLPGFGLSDAPDHKSFQYTFDHLAEIIGDFVDQFGLKKFAVYIFDDGAPVGLRVALRFPDRISALHSGRKSSNEEGQAQVAKTIELKDRGQGGRQERLTRSVLPRTGKRRKNHRKEV